MMDRLNRVGRGRLLLVVAAGLLVVVAASLARTDAAFRQLDLLIDVRHEIVERYVRSVDQHDLAEAAVRGMIDSLEDPHTTYLSAEDLQPLDDQVRDRFTGIGAEITFDEEIEQLRIVTPLEDSPAYRSGVMARDVVLEIDGTPTSAIFEDLPTNAHKLREAISRLKGPADTDVTIRVRHESGEEELVTIRRALIEVKGVRGFRRDADNRWVYMLDAANRIGYVKVRQFTERTADELRAALDELVALDAQGIVMDLRWNPGGLLSAAVAVSDMFLEEGKTIVSVKGRSGPNSVETSTSAQTVTTVPLVVLANEASASASEIVTGALTDNGRAKFVGMRTFGKGSVQQIRKLDRSAGAVKITTAYYYLPNGRLIHRREDSEQWGVDPEDGFFLPMTPAQIRRMHRIAMENRVLPEHGNTPADPDWIERELGDLQLAAGLRAMLGKLATGQWPAVGRAGAEVLAREAKRKNLLASRDLMRERLERIEEELVKLDAEEAVQEEGDAADDSPRPDADVDADARP